MRVDDEDDFAWRGFAEHLSLAQRADGAYEGWCLPGRGNRPYGGHLIAQSLLLVQDTSGSGMVPMSVHAHFLSSGDTRLPVEYHVEGIRSGRSFEHWLVRAAQAERVLSQATIVLHRPEASPEHDVRPHRPGGPDGLPVITFSPREGTRRAIRTGLEIRRGAQWTSGDPSDVPYQDTWYRCVEDLPVEVADVILTWCTDLELAWTVDLPYRAGVRSRVAASLDHTIHFHRPFDPARWWLYEQESPVLAGGRGLVTGRIFTEEGDLVASISQQTMLRLEFED